MNSNTKRSVLSLSVLAVVLILRSSVFAEASLPWLGNNLLKNPGFEAKPEKDKPIPGWTSQPHGNTVIAAVDNSIRLAGKASLHISVPKSPSSIVFKSEPIPVSAGKRFLYSIAYRQTGFNTSGKPDAYEGVSSHSQ
ncbi:MAG: hypothetical protein QF473_28600, partial [Planctomycetota bacterium]|nr:hypothetical protein [Planctomycetota bacterium]